jgi:hypothetical protein
MLVYAPHAQLTHIKKNVDEEKGFTMLFRVLELFCGTKSIGKYCATRTDTYMTYSLDVNPKCKPDVVGDIMAWNYRDFPPGFFHIIWASPPCTQYSIARTTGGPRDIPLANAIVLRTLEIIAYFQPKVWFMENPGTGLLKQQWFMKDIPYVDVHYCKYGYPYRKWTRIWTNLDCRHTGFVPKVCKNDCDAMVEDQVSGCPRHRSTFSGNISGVSLNQRYSIPPLLVKQLFEAAAIQASTTLCGMDVA